GVIGLEAAAAMPVRSLLSGPSTGVVGAQAVAGAAGVGDLITLDKGRDVATDVALLKDGQVRLASEAALDGYPLKVPMLAIHTVGAGGGSIPFLDTGGLLKVGPRSAGADLGPVCYARGNQARSRRADAWLGQERIEKAAWPTHALRRHAPCRPELRAVGAASCRPG